MKIADISSYQGNIDWTKAREELELIIFRASVGKNKDTKYLSYTKNCGVPYGAYHYVKAGTDAEAREEAKLFLEAANAAAKKPYFYIADIEYEAQTSKTTEAVCVAFLEELRKAGCKKIGMYINTRYKWAGKAIDMCDIIWIPHWGENRGDVPGKAAKPEYYHDIWQYTSAGKVNGIKGNVDLDMLAGHKDLSYFTTYDVPANVKPNKYELGDRVLREGSRSTDVKDLQAKLNKELNLSLVTDGIFGAKTVTAIKTLQKQVNLEITGIYDNKTHNALIGMKEVIYTTSQEANVRAGDSTNYPILTTLKKNIPITPILDKNKKPLISTNGWYAILLPKAIGWISGKLVKKEG